MYKDKKTVSNNLHQGSPIQRFPNTDSQKSTNAATKQSVAQLLLAKFENKYASASNAKAAKASDTEITDSDSTVESEPDDEILEAKKLNHDRLEANKLDDDRREAKKLDDIPDYQENYDSDFETSDSENSVKDESLHSKAQYAEEKSLPLPRVDEITSSEDSIRVNILPLEVLLKKNELLSGRITNSDSAEVSELLETELITRSTQDKPDRSSPPPRICTENTSSVNFSRRENAITFKEEPASVHEVENQTDGPISTVRVNELVDSERWTRGTSEAAATERNNVVSSLADLPIDDPSRAKHKSSGRTKSNSKSVPDNQRSVKQADATRKQSRETKRQCLEKRRLERLFFSVESGWPSGDVEQPVFSPLPMSWRREDNVGTGLHSTLASSEDAFAECLRLRLRVTRDKMAAEYAAYRSCCAAARTLAAAHKPVTLADTRQMIEQTKR